jgi:superfamily II DNA or RNA helicase
MPILNERSTFMIIEISDKIVLRGLDEKDIETITDDLTFVNPKYEKIKKYSKWGSTSEPKYLEYFKIYEEDNQMCAEVPVGYNIKNLITPDMTVEDIVDYRKCAKVKDFPKFVLTLRETQQQARTSYLTHNLENHFLKGSIQLPTGKGKTILALSIASTLRARTLIIVHKDDLVTGWKKDIELAFEGKADVGLIKAKSRKVGKHFTIATIQTLNRLSLLELNSLYDSFGLVVQDEMHHCPSSSFALGNRFNCRYRLGLTATPERADGLAQIMTLYYGDFCYTYKPTAEERENDTDILNVEVIRRKVPIYFDPVFGKKKDGSFVSLKSFTQDKHFIHHYPLNTVEVRASRLPYGNPVANIPHLLIDKTVVLRPETVRYVCNDILKEYTNNHNCIAFFLQKEEIEFYKDYLTSSLGIPEEDIGLYYGDNKDCNNVLKTAESRRRFITLATYSKATEGTNVKQWEVAFLVSSINSGKNVEQAVGRVRRVKEGKLSIAKVYDYRYDDVYRLCRHGSTRDRRYSKLGFFKVGSKKSIFSHGFKFDKFR